MSGFGACSRGFRHCCCCCCCYCHYCCFCTFCSSCCSSCCCCCYRYCCCRSPAAGRCWHTNPLRTGLPYMGQSIYELDSDICFACSAAAKELHVRSFVSKTGHAGFGSTLNVAEDRLLQTEKMKPHQHRLVFVSRSPEEPRSVASHGCATTNCSPWLHT